MTVTIVKADAALIAVIALGPALAGLGAGAAEQFQWLKGAHSKEFGGGNTPGMSP